jgi:hypothetical protein
MTTANHAEFQEPQNNSANTDQEKRDCGYKGKLTYALVATESVFQ